MIRRRGRRGVALVGALALLTVSGIVVAALVASSITAQRSTRLVGSDAAALASAEYAASSILAGALAYQLRAAAARCDAAVRGRSRANVGTPRRRGRYAPSPRRSLVRRRRGSARARLE